MVSETVLIAGSLVLGGVLLVSETRTRINNWKREKYVVETSIRMKGFQTLMDALREDTEYNVKEIPFSWVYLQKASTFKKWFSKGDIYTKTIDGELYALDSKTYTFQHNSLSEKIMLRIMLPLLEVQQNPLTMQFNHSIDYLLTTLSHLSYKLEEESFMEQVDNTISIVTDMVQFVKDIEKEAQEHTDRYEKERLSYFLNKHNKALDLQKCQLKLLLEQGNNRSDE